MVWPLYAAVVGCIDLYRRAATGAIFSQLRGVRHTGCLLATIDKEMRKNGPVPSACGENPAILHSRPRQRPATASASSGRIFSRNAARLCRSIHPEQSGLLANRSFLSLLNIGKVAVVGAMQVGRFALIHFSLELKIGCVTSTGRMDASLPGPISRADSARCRRVPRIC